MADDVSPGLGLGGEDSPWAHDMPVPPAPPLPASWVRAEPATPVPDVAPPVDPTVAPPEAPLVGPAGDGGHAPLPPAASRRSRPALIGVGLVGIVAALVVGSQVIGDGGSDGDEAASEVRTETSLGRPDATDRTVRTIPPPSSTERVRPSTSAALPEPEPVWVTAPIALDPRLQAMTVPMQLVVLNGAGTVHVIEIPTGAMRSIDTAVGRSSLAMVVGDRAIAVTSYEDGSMVVVDPEAAVADVDLPGGAGQILARPGTNDFLVTPNNWSGNRMPPNLLVAADGTTTEDTEGPLGGYDIWAIRFLPATGELVVDDSGGTYAIGAAGAVRRVSVGDLVAVGENHVLVRECDEALVCEHVRIDAITGDRQPAVVPDLENQFRGYDPTIGVSPDGSMMTYLDWETGPQERRLVQLDTGASEVIESNDQYGYGANAGWAADSSGLFVIDGRRLVFHDLSTGGLIEVAPGVDLGSIAAVAARPRAG